MHNCTYQHSQHRNCFKTGERGKIWNCKCHKYNLWCWAYKCCPHWPCGCGRPRSISLCPCTKAPDDFDDKDDNDNDDGADADDKADNKAEDRDGDEAENENENNNGDGDGDGNDNDIIIMLSPTTELSRIDQDHVQWYGRLNNREGTSQWRFLQNRRKITCGHVHLPDDHNVVLPWPRGWSRPCRQGWRRRPQPRGPTVSRCELLGDLERFCLN